MQNWSSHAPKSPVSIEILYEKRPSSESGFSTKLQRRTFEEQPRVLHVRLER